MGNLVLGLLIGAAVAGGGALAVHVRSVRRLDRMTIDVERTKDALRDQERTARGEREVQDLILRSMEEGVLLIDPEERTVFANAAVEQHLGGRPANVDALLPADLQAAVRRAGFTGAVIRAVVETGTPSRWLRAVAAPVGDDGTVLLVIRNVTEARRIDQVRRDFVANASHELKTPAASIQAAAETISAAAASEDPESVARFAAQLERDALRLSRIVADLLDLSRLETGSDLGERVRMDLIVREECGRLVESLQGAGRLEIDAPDVPALLGSGRDLALLVRNLVDNAVRHSMPEGSVTVRLTADDAAVTLTVSDTGEGIPTRDLDRIFERFYRVDPARSRVTGGTGLGLAIVRHVAENHGGSVRVVSELGQGSAFEVILPLARADGDDVRSDGRV